MTLSHSSENGPKLEVGLGSISCTHTQIKPNNMLVDKDVPRFFSSLKLSLSFMSLV